MKMSLWAKRSDRARDGYTSPPPAIRTASTTACNTPRHAELNTVEPPPFRCNLRLTSSKAPCTSLFRPDITPRDRSLFRRIRNANENIGTRTKRIANTSFEVVRFKRKYVRMRVRKSGEWLATTLRGVGAVLCERGRAAGCDLAEANDVEGDA